MQQFDEAVTTLVCKPSKPPPPVTNRVARVLLVHSDHSFRRTVAAYLENQGFVTVARAKGREALRDACDLAFDAVVMDLDGDQYDEFELLSCFATLPRRVPAIVCSAYAGTQGPELAVLHELGVRHVLPRPCRLELVVRALRDLGALPAPRGEVTR